MPGDMQGLDRLLHMTPTTDPTLPPDSPQTFSAILGRMKDYETAIAAFAAGEGNATADDVSIARHHLRAIADDYVVAMNPRSTDAWLEAASGYLARAMRGVGRANRLLRQL